MKPSRMLRALMRAGPVWGGGGLRTRWPERIGNEQIAGKGSSHLHIAHLCAYLTITHTDEERDPLKFTCWPKAEPPHDIGEN